MNIFELLSAFDGISVLWNTAKDIRHAMADGEPTSDIYLSKINLGFAEIQLKRAGVDVISNVQEGLNPVAGLKIRDSQYNEAVAVLAGCGIEVWQ